jgi:hypothetical protein
MSVAISESLSCASRCWLCARSISRVEDWCKCEEEEVEEEEAEEKVRGRANKKN